MRIKEITEAALDLADPNEVEKLKNIKTRRRYDYAPSHHRGATDYEWRGPDQFPTTPDPTDTDDQDYEILGKGVEATVVKDKSQPKVIKIHHGFGHKLDKIDNIAYMQYILLSKKYGSQNPFLPRIYSIKKNVVDHTVTDYIIQLEELTPMDKVPPAFIRLIAKNLFKDPDIIKRVGGNANVLTNIVKDAFSDTTLVKDVNFKNVVKVIHAVNRKRHFHWNKLSGLDIHIGNIMVRTTPYGPQLVITDPLI